MRVRSKLGEQNWVVLCVAARAHRRDRLAGGHGPAPGVGDVRYSLLCVHWAQCKGDLSRAGSARRRSPAAPTWTFTCARIQASGPISATRVSSASRRSPASIYIRGRTQVGDSRGPDWPSARPAPLHSPLLRISPSYFAALSNIVRSERFGAE